MALTKPKKKSVPADSSDSEPDLSPVDSGDEQGSSEDDDSVYDSEDGLEPRGDNDDEDDEFEEQGSSDDEEDRLERQQALDSDDEDDDVQVSYEDQPRSFSAAAGKRGKSGQSKSTSKDKGSANPTSSASPGEVSKWVHTDDLSSDDEDDDGEGNRIGKVPLHWYDEYDHIGFNAHGQKVMKSATNGDRLDQAIALQDNRAQGKFVVHDMLNDKNVELTPRQIELIRRVQAGAFAHPEHDGNPDYVDYFSGVDPEISGLNSGQYEPKARFQPSQWEEMQVQKMLEKLEKGEVSMDYLKGKVKTMRTKSDDEMKALYMLWKGDEEDELAMRKGPTHIAAPKAPPPTHAESYVPPDEYLPTPEELEAWKDMDPKDRPHGLLVPKKFPNLRSVGAYEHAVRETFERCLDLYLAPRAMKRRLNIDPESLVPKLPKASDLKPFPNAQCIEYVTPHDPLEPAPMVRALAASPDGQFLASGASDGYVRLWEVESGRLLQSWEVSQVAKDAVPKDDKYQDANADKAKPVVALEWNPNRAHHCLLVAVGKCVVVLATGTAGQNDAPVTEALLETARKGGKITNSKAQKAVKWVVPLDVSEPGVPLTTSNKTVGPVCVLCMSHDVASVRWQSKGDYFCSVSPKAGAPAVLIHQLSRGNSQQPFSKAKGEAQLACFHPSKPFLFVASQQHVRVYHLVKQAMVKRLVSGCRWISSIDVHPSGDHLIVGSLDRRMIWFDLDLASTPYKTLKYHERALRSCRFHGRYPLMASASDDGSVHVFHSMVYNDLMRNPFIIPVKILRGHSVTKDKLGVLSVTFHPTQPWLFSAGADGKIILFQDI